MLKATVRYILVGVCLVAALTVWAGAQSSWESEKLALETTMQSRVEKALSRLLQEGTYVVVVQVEPLSAVAGKAGRAASGEGYYLPGVPARTVIDGTSEVMKDLVDTLSSDQKNFLRFVRRVSVLLILDESLSDNTIDRVRELTRQILSLEPARGDVLNIQRAVLRTPDLPVSQDAVTRLQSALKNYWIIISLSLILFCIAVFLLFVFGPLRGFLNRFVQVLPTLKPNEPESGRYSRVNMWESQVLPAMMAQTMSMLPGGAQGGGGAGSNFSGSLLVENPNKKTTPFGFVREDHLSNLATLLSRETPEKAAVVLGYLPPEWISRVLAKMEPSLQSEITENLATPRQLLPEQVEDIEQDLKRRLDYLIGGPDRILAIYESLGPEHQRRMLDNLRIIRPELAEELRRHTLLFEDLEELEDGSLKTLLREVELQTLIMSMRGISDSFKVKIMKNLSAGKAEIVKEELEFNDGPVGPAVYEAQKKMVFLARRLEKEGQMQISRPDESAPNVRYGSSLQSGIKLPPGFNAGSGEPLEGEPVESGGLSSIEDRIKEFMSRGASERERYPLDAEQTQGDNPSHDE